MVPGIMLSEDSFARLVGMMITPIILIGVISSLIAIVAGIKFWKGAARPQEGEGGVEETEKRKRSKAGIDSVQEGGGVGKTEKKKRKRWKQPAEGAGGPYNVDANPFPNHVDANPQQQEEPHVPLLPIQGPVVPDWANVGSKPPSSYADLLESTPHRLLRNTFRPTCLVACGGQHNRLTKRGSNAFTARISCADCGRTMAVYHRPEVTAAP